ncbi:MAG: metallophosphoesterase [Clostridia bacterium]|nr:metallophosphoesterase [Clostridia bacterium]
MDHKHGIALSLLSAASLAGGLYCYFENTSPTVSSFTVKSEKLGRSFDGFRICQISDFHNTHSSSLRAALTEQIARFSPDLIAVTGDLVDCRRTDVDSAVRFVADLVSLAPVYYVTGNHEARIIEYRQLRSELEALGVHVLENEAVTLRRGGAGLQIIGIHDPRIAHEPSIPDAEIAQRELAAVGVDPDCFSLLLFHRPDLLELYADAGITLALTGHAHGGQIRLPFIGGLLAPQQGWFPRWTNGLHRQGTASMIVSRGIGNSLFPFRINNRPELVCVTLEAARNEF